MSVSVDPFRKAVGAKMNKETLLCHIDKLLDHYAPGEELTEEDLSNCRQYLLTSGLLKKHGENKLYWRDLEEGSTLTTKKEDEDSTQKDAEKTNGSDTQEEDADSDTDQELTENDIFVCLKSIIVAIIGYATGNTIDGCKKADVFELVPNQCLALEIADEEHKLDTARANTTWDTKGKLLTSRAALTLFSKNRLQTVADCRYIMNVDPRRMYIYAVSVEDNRMSVWYFSRSHSMKSLAFDWIHEDIEKCIYVFLAFARSTPKQLGVDDTVTLAPRDINAPVGSVAADQHFIYRCPVKPGPNAPADTPKFKYFKTTQNINEMRPYNIAGRNTRIWKVVEVKGPASNEVVTSQEFVLKDVWLEAKRATEADNLDRIFEALEELVRDSEDKWGDDWKKELVKQDTRFAAFDEATKDELGDLLTDHKYKSLFLTKLHAWQGETSLDVCSSAMHSPPGVDIFRGEASKTDHHNQSASWTMVGSAIPSVHSQATPGNNQETERPFAPKTQSRFIYEEVCSDLDTVGTLGNFMDLINQALQALRILYCAGWVHRDISSNNILAFKDNGKWKVKLSDLEFSREQAKGPTERDPRTGTPFFMPIEIMSNSHLVLGLYQTVQTGPAQTLAGQLGLVEGTAEYECLVEFNRIGKDERLPSDANLEAIPTYETTVLHTFQHDLESIWWTVLYFITARVEHEAPEINAKLRLAAGEIFQHGLEPSMKRRHCFNVPFARSGLLKKLHPHLQTLFGRPMETLRGAMISQYQLRQVYGRIQVPHTYSSIHATFASQFAALLQDNTNNWKQLPILSSSSSKKNKQSSKVVVGAKRGRDDDSLAATPKKAKQCH